MEPIRILLVEDQTLMRQGLKTILDLEPGLHVVGEASDGEAGVQAALELRPDVILMDVQLPKRNGVEATAAICAAWPQARVIILTTFDRDDYVFRGVRAGAVGYLSFSGDLDTCIAIRTLVVERDKTSVTAGAGIVADSDPASEEKETENKAAALLQAVALAQELEDFS